MHAWETVVGCPRFESGELHHYDLNAVSEKCLAVKTFSIAEHARQLDEKLKAKHSAR